MADWPCRMQGPASAAGRAADPSEMSWVRTWMLLQQESELRHCLLALVATEAMAFQNKNALGCCGLTYISLSLPIVAQPSGLKFG